MPRTAVITQEIYTYEELSDEGKAAARDWWRNLETQEFDGSDSYDDFNTVAELLGITFYTVPVKLMGGKTRQEPAIRWSGFCSQGDGASFSGSYAYAKNAVTAIREHAPQDEVLHRIADQLEAAQAPHLGLIIATSNPGNGSNHYSHSNTMHIAVDREEDSTGLLADISHDPTAEALHHWGLAEAAVAQLLRDFADWMYRQLEAEWDYRTSDEYVAEAIEANAYEFTEDGAIA